MASLTFRRQLTVEWGDCDPAGIVFNPRFFEFFDASSWLLFETALGVKQQEIASTYGIVGIALVDARANFLKPIKFGDTIEIASRISEFRRSSFDVEHRISIGERIGRRRRRNTGVGDAQRRRPGEDRGNDHSKRCDRQI